MNDDFYINHLEKEVFIRKYAKKYFTIERSEYNTLNSNYILNEYIIFHQDIPIFKYEMETHDKPILTKITKNKKVFEITDEKSMIDFVECCFIFLNKLLNDFNEINNNFYIYEPNFYDNVRLKVTFNDKNIHEVYIFINIDGSFTLNIEGIDIIEYLSIDELISSKFISKIKKNIFFTCLSYLKLF